MFGRRRTPSAQPSLLMFHMSKYELQGGSTSEVKGGLNEWFLMIMMAKLYSGNHGGLKLPDIPLTDEENPRTNLTQETCPDRGSNPGPLRDRRASYCLLHSGGLGVPYWSPSSTDKFISCVVPGPSQWFFHDGIEIIIAWTHIGWMRWMFHNLPLPVAQEVRDSSGVTPSIIMKNDGVQYHQVSQHASHSLWKRSCVLQHRVTSILIQELIFKGRGYWKF